MNDLIFDSNGWNNYLYWQMQDRKTLNFKELIMKFGEIL